MTVEEHNKYLAYSFFAYSGFQMVWLGLIGIWFWFITQVPGNPGDPEFPAMLFALMFGFMAVFQIIFTAPAAIAGYGLLTHKKWARVASIIAGVMSAMSVPVGTAVCVYSLWFFLGGPGKEMYEDGRTAPADSMLGLNAAPAGHWESETHHENEYVNPPRPSDWR